MPNQSLYFVFLMHVALFLLMLFPFVLSAQNVTSPDGIILSGKVTDAVTAEAIPGAAVFFPDLKKSVLTEADGSYKVSKIPQKELLIQVSFLGYKTLTQKVNTEGISKMDFALQPSVKEINEIVVTGTPASAEKDRVSVPMAIMRKEQLDQSGGSSMMEGLAKLPGLNILTTGAGIAKPIVRGLGFNRVVVVHDGIRQEGQQWGDEHGLELDEFGVSRIEIIKGPASLSYGSDALAGVVHFITAPVLPEGKNRGEALMGYQTNNGQFGYSGNFAGNTKGLLYDIRLGGKNAHAYRNAADGLVYGSAFSEKSASLMTGLNRKWGFSHLHLSVIEMLPGIPEGERDSTTGSFLKQVVINDSTIGYAIASDDELRSYGSVIPYQNVKHYKISSNSNFSWGDGYLRTTLGFQQNHRKEFSDPFMPDEAALYFLTNTGSYDVKYIFPNRGKVRSSVGINGMLQGSMNRGKEYLIPDYKMNDAGAFALLSLVYDKLDFSFGARYDIRLINTEEAWRDSLGEISSPGKAGTTLQFEKLDRTLNGISGSAGMVWQLNKKLISKFNIARGFRAPNLAELSSNGIHEGSGRFEIGEKALKPETNLQLDLSWGVHSDHLTLELDLFYNRINHFIYNEKLNSVFGGDSIPDLNDPVPAFKFVQGNAHLYGGEFFADLHPHPLDWLHLENTFALVYAQQLNTSDSTQYLPGIPAPKYSLMLKGEFGSRWKKLRNLYVKAGMDYTFKQNRYYSAYGTETETAGYVLIDVGTGFDWFLKDKKRASVFIHVNNLTDTIYQSHLSRLKYASENYATGTRGIYNMGRNVNLKLVVPF